MDVLRHWDKTFVFIKFISSVLAFGDLSLVLDDEWDPYELFWRVHNALGYVFRRSGSLMIWRVVSGGRFGSSTTEPFIRFLVV